MCVCMYSVGHFLHIHIDKCASTLERNVTTGGQITHTNPHLFPLLSLKVNLSSYTETLLRNRLLTRTQTGKTAPTQTFLQKEIGAHTETPPGTDLTLERKRKKKRDRKNAGKKPDALLQRPSHIQPAERLECVTNFSRSSPHRLQSGPAPDSPASRSYCPSGKESGGAGS